MFSIVNAKTFCDRRMTDKKEIIRPKRQENNYTDPRIELYRGVQRYCRGGAGKSGGGSIPGLLVDIKM